MFINTYTTAGTYAVASNAIAVRTLSKGGAICRITSQYKLQAQC